MEVVDIASELGLKEREVIEGEIVEDISTLALYSGASEIEKAKRDFVDVEARAMSTSPVLCKVVDNTGKIVARISAECKYSIPIVQMPKTTVDDWSYGDVAIEKTFQNYTFEFLYTYIPGTLDYDTEMKRLIDSHKASVGKDRLKYCFSVKTKVGFGSFSFFIDCLTKNIIAIQGLETFIGSDVKVSATYFDNSNGTYALQVQKVSLFVVGTIMSNSSDLLSPGSFCDSAVGDNTVISANKEKNITDIFDAFVTNNTNLSAKYISVSAASMYGGKDASYQLVNDTVDNVNTIRTNTPPLLLLELGKQNNLVSGNEDDSIPNVLVYQMSCVNNYFYFDNGTASDANSNFVLMLPVY